MKHLLVTSLGDANSGSELQVMVWDPATESLVAGKQPMATTFLVRLSKSVLLDRLVVDAGTSGATACPFGSGEGAALPGGAGDYALAYLPLQVEIFGIGGDAPTGPGDLVRLASGDNLMFSYTMARNH